MAKKSIAKNSIALLISSVFQKLIGFAYFIFLTNNIVTDSVGKYSFASSFALIFCVFMDFGTNALLIREISRNEEKTNKYVNNVLVLEFILGAIFIAVSMLLANLIGYPEITKHLIYIAIFSVFLDNIATTFFAILRGRQEIWYESFGYACYQIIVFTLGFIIVKKTNNLLFLALPPLIASFANLLFSIIVTVKKKYFKFTFDFDVDFVKMLLRMALPFALTGIFTKLYSSVDSLFLSWFTDDTQIAYYQAAFKIVFALQFIPIAIGSAVYPAFSKYYKEDKEQLKSVFMKCFTVLAMVAIPMSFGMFAISGDVINLFYPEYDSVRTLQIFSASFFCMFLNNPVGLALSASDKQKINTIDSFISMIVNIILNWITIPIFGIVGAAFSSVISFIVLFTLNFIQAKKSINFKIWPLVINIIKILIASVIMYFCVIYLKEYLNFLIVIPIVMIIYFVLIMLLRVIKIRDIKSLLKRNG